MRLATKESEFVVGGHEVPVEGVQNYHTYGLVIDGSMTHFKVRLADEVKECVRLAYELSWPGSSLHEAAAKAFKLVFPDE